jgi:hypothetical protein
MIHMHGVSGKEEITEREESTSTIVMYGKDVHVIIQTGTCSTPGTAPCTQPVAVRKGSASVAVRTELASRAKPAGLVMLCSARVQADPVPVRRN